MPRNQHKNITSQEGWQFCDFMETQKVIEPEDIERLRRTINQIKQLVDDPELDEKFQIKSKAVSILGEATGLLAVYDALKIKDNPGISIVWHGKLKTGWDVKINKCRIQIKATGEKNDFQFYICTIETEPEKDAIINDLRDKEKRDYTKIYNKIDSGIDKIKADYWILVNISADKGPYILSKAQLKEISKFAYRSSVEKQKHNKDWNYNLSKRGVLQHRLLYKEIGVELERYRDFNSLQKAILGAAR